MSAYDTHAKIRDDTPVFPVHCTLSNCSLNMGVSVDRSMQAILTLMRGAIISLLTTLSCFNTRLASRPLAVLCVVELTCAIQE